jgi:hypothetical protein
MKTNLLYSLKSTVRTGDARIAAKSNLTILLLLFAALALAGCEGMISGSSGAASPWPAAPTGSSTPPASQTGFASGLAGQWYHDGKPTSIRVDPDGRNLTIIDENGRRTSGVANSPYELQFGGLKGSVGHGGGRISWTNGTEWTRDAGQSGSQFGQRPVQDQNLNGRWYHDGKPTSISVSSGGSVTITNEQGQSSRGSMSGNEIVISGGLRGHVGEGGQRISWNNGTEWRR